MGTVQESWNRIHAWMSTHQPGMLELLRDGASEDHIEYLEDALGLNQLPEEFKASYRIHDGATGRFLFHGDVCGSFLSINEIFVQWSSQRKNLREVKNVGCEIYDQETDEVKNKIWTYGWIPFSVDVFGNNICLDLEPTYVGIYGQVISWSSLEFYINNPMKLEDSFAIYLHDFANNVESGNYALSEDGQHLINNLDKLSKNSMFCD